MNLIAIYTSISINEINYVRTLLESSGINAVILDETIGQIAPHHLFGQGGPRLSVAEQDVQKAKIIIKDYEDSKKEQE